MGSTSKSETVSASLDRLAELLGIESEYSDARGKVRRTRETTKRALLAAMGVHAADDSQVSASLAEIGRSKWNRGLQPVYVVHAPPSNEPISVPVTLREGTPEISWRLRLEEGIESRAKNAPSELPLVERQEIDGQRFERRELALGNDIPWGYHRLRIDPGGSEAAVIVTPQQCWLPPSVDAGERIWGIAAQLYVVKSHENWGIGDLSDLGRLAELCSAAGADILGVNPLHALFPGTPEHASPYSPSSRLLLNILYIDVTAAPGFLECAQAQELVRSAEFQEQLAKARSDPLVDYPRVAKLKLQALRTIFERWMESPGSARSPFEGFRQEQAEVLERSCAFYCLQQRFIARDPGFSDWRKWPEEYRNPESEAVRRFVAEHEKEVTFAAWMQWLADVQLSVAAKAAKSMEIGLYRDMAVGADMCGVETWSNQEAVVSEAHVGAPPDIFNPAGQDWGLPPFHPRALKEQRYKVFVDLIRANMRYAGALRIDHVMALQHLYWIPEGELPQNGAYVRYPTEDFLGILALESQRNRCMVVGEDLGTVPDGFRERMARANILSYRVLFFEQNMKTGVYRKPKDYPRLAVAVASNHDLPSVPAWWLGRDIELRDQLKLYPDSNEARYQWKLRERDKNQLRRILESQGLLRKGQVPTADELVLLAYACLARSHSFAVLVQLDDITWEMDPVNLPGSIDQYPNWRRKISVPLGELLQKVTAKEIIRLFTEGRPTVRPVLEKSLH